MAEANREEAERACRRAEEHFVAGNVAAARQLAGKAQRLYPSLPGVANAVAAYAIHASAPDWHAVLDVDRPATADAVKRQFRRLSLLVHPDKNRSAAAEGAFKLLRKACDALSSGTDHATCDAPAAQDSTPAKAPAPEKPRPADKADSSRRAESFRQTPSRVRCKHCGASKEVTRVELKYGLVRCPRCHSVLPRYVRRASESYNRVPTETSSPPAQKKTKPRPPTTFRCPARCPFCQTQFTCMVSTGSWLLQCKNCLKDAMVHVKGPGAATCT